jgi:hypothetical protein
MTAIRPGDSKGEREFSGLRETKNRYILTKQRPIATAGYRQNP